MPSNGDIFNWEQTTCSFTRHLSPGFRCLLAALVWLLNDKGGEKGRVQPVLWSEVATEAKQLVCEKIIQHCGLWWSDHCDQPIKDLNKTFVCRLISRRPLHNCNMLHFTSTQLSSAPSSSSTKLTLFLKPHVSVGCGHFYQWFMNGQRQHKDWLVCVLI